MTTQSEKAQRFVDLHQSGTFVIPNFWDVGSAVMLQNLGFEALASTSAGFAQTLGKMDSEITLEQKLAHLSQVAGATNIPISADFEHGFADSPEECAANLMRAAETGIVGASIEDWSRTSLYDIGLATDRMAACKEAVDKLDFKFTLTARAENLLRGIGTIDDTLQRLQAYEAAGADVLYAPGLSNDEQIRTVLQTVSCPINVLFVFMPEKNLASYQALGVRRVSLGSALANHMIGATLKASKALINDGDFTWIADAASGRTINSLLKP